MQIKLVPADGIKGKTWGPSTLHQSRVRSFLPALSQTSTQNPSHFSKSAPNLDKSRPAGHDSPTNASASSFLGKSVDGLNIIKNNNNNNNYYSNNSTKLGSVDCLNNGNRYARHNEQLYDDDDDDDEATPGCFSFIGRNDTVVVSKRKKHSLDSKMVENNPNPNLMPTMRIAVEPFSLAAYIQDNNDVDDDTTRQNVDLNTADVPYDRVFFRKIQKSLDDISMAYGHQPFEKQHFDRECFLVNPSDNENDSSFDAGASTNQDFSQKSIELSFNNEQHPNDSDKFSSEELIYQDEQTHSSSDTALTSRKNSVTFRDDDGSAQYSLLSDASIESNKIQTYANKTYEIITNGNWSHSNHTDSHQTNSNGSQKMTLPKKEHKEKHSKYTNWRFFARKKTAKTDMNEQLLDDDSKHCAPL